MYLMSYFVALSFSNKSPSQAMEYRDQANGLVEQVRGFADTVDEKLTMMNNVLDVGVFITITVDLMWLICACSLFVCSPPTACRY